MFSAHELVQGIETMAGCPTAMSTKYHGRGNWFGGKSVAFSLLYRTLAGDSSRGSTVSLETTKSLGAVILFYLERTVLYKAPMSGKET